MSEGIYHLATFVEGDEIDGCDECCFCFGDSDCDKDAKDGFKCGNGVYGWYSVEAKED